MRFACVWVGTKYGAEYVQHLRDGILRHHPNAKMWCLTDHQEVPDGVVKIDVSSYKLDGWWNKLLLFKPGILPKGRYLYLDLDVIMLGEFPVVSSGFHCMQDVTGRINSSAMYFHTNEVSSIWHHFARNPISYSRDLRGDQDFIWQHVHEYGVQFKFFDQHLFPVWKHHQNLLNENTVAWVLHGRPKPNQIPNHDKSIWEMNSESISIDLSQIPTNGIGKEGTTFFIDPVMRNPYWKGCAASHALAARKALMVNGPVLILESDATTRKGVPDRYVIPAETDAVYCGLSQWGHSGRRASWKPTRNRDLVRLTNMLASHAIMLVSHRYKEQYLKWATDPKEPFDIALAQNQPRYNVLALKNPPYYQGPESNMNARSTNWRIV